MRAEPWPHETRHARFHSGVIIPPQPAKCCGDGRHCRAYARDAALRVFLSERFGGDFEEWRRRASGIMQALTRHVERVFNRDRKDQHWGKRKLKRDE
jgi:hypothetical protein